MKMNKWTLALAAVGLVSLTSAQAEEAKLVPVLSTVSATTISGYVDTSAQWNPGTGNANPAPFAFNNGKQDGFNVNSVDLRISKAADETQWSAGYMVDLMFGPDAASVNGTGINGTVDGFSDNIRQAYVDLRAPIGTGLGLKVGRFDGLIGYESTDSYKNANFTHSYGYTFEPTENTGVIAHYNFSECFAADAGIANTVTTFGINQRNLRGIESKKAYLGLLTFTAPKSWGFLADDNLVIGVDQGPGSFTEDRTHLYAGTTLYTPLKGLNFGVAYDANFHGDVNGVDTGYSTAVAGYAVFKPEQSKWGTALRVEYAHGDILDALSAANNGGRSPGTAAGFGSFPGSENRFHEVFALTGTVSYDLWANVLTRLEARWDHALDGSAPFGATIGNSGSQNNEVSLIANLVYKF